MIKRLFGLAIFAVVLTAVLSATPAFAGEIPTAPATAPALAAPAAGGCGQAIALPAKGETCSAAQPESVLPGVIAPLTARLGYCHCGCSSVRTCRTSADCGGASCDQAISCC
jgi:hypothetical protein